MNSTDPQGDLLQPRSSDDGSIAELRALCGRLQYLLMLSLASIVLICLAVSVFMGKQYRTVQPTSTISANR